MYECACVNVYLFEGVYACVCVCTFLCRYVCMCVYVCVFVCTFICWCVYMCVFVYVCVQFKPVRFFTFLFVFASSSVYFSLTKFKISSSFQTFIATYSYFFFFSFFFFLSLRTLLVHLYISFARRSSCLSTI